MAERSENDKIIIRYLLPSLLVLVGLIFTTSSNVFTHYDSALTIDFDYIIFAFFISIILLYVDFEYYGNYLIGITFLAKILFSTSFSFILFSFFILKGTLNPDNMNIKLNPYQNYKYCLL